MNSTRKTSHASVLRVFQSKDQTRAFYNKISRVYDLLSERSEAAMRKAGLELLCASAGESVLEIGFGTGHSLVSLAKPSGRKAGYSAWICRTKCLSWLKPTSPKPSSWNAPGCVAADATQLPYEADSLDAVFMSFTLELFDTPEIPKVLRECKRVLRPGGRIAVVGMSKDAKHDPLIGVFEWTHEHFPNFLDCRPIYVREALETAGFKTQNALKKHMWIPVEIVLAAKQVL